MSDERAEVPSPTPARVWGDQWLRVNEKVLKGLNHQLTNRVASIDGVVGVLEPGEPLDEQMLAALRGELQRLDTLLRLYRLLPAEPSVAPEPVRLQDVLSQVVELHTYHSDLRSVPCELIEDPDAEPVCVRPSALLRSLLVLLESAAGHARRSGSEAPIVLRLMGRGAHVAIAVEGPSPTTDALFSGGGSLVDAVRSSVAHVDGSIEATRGSTDAGPFIRYELTLPSLRETRRREIASR
jgi:signal transduction histidine kinase